MSELHEIGLSAENIKMIEAVGPQFVREGLLEARRKSWEAYHLISKRLEVGMTELAAFEMAMKTFEELGVSKHWHKPWVRFGPGTVLTFYDLRQPTYRLQKNDMVYMDLGPIWKDEASGLEYEGDVGDSFVFGENAEAERCVAAIHRLFKEASEKWRAEGSSGEVLYELFNRRSRELGYELIEKVDGHRLSDYPHVKFSKERLSKIRFVPSEALWILELQIKHPTLPLGAFYEDLLLK